MRDAVTDQKDTDDVSGAANAAGDDDEPLPPEEAEEGVPVEATADPPAEVAELSDACVRFVATRYGLTLDYQPDTLSLVDQWVRDAREELGQAALSSPPGAPPPPAEIVELVQSAAGAYLGEVIRRDRGARWVTPADRAEWRLCMSTVYCAFNPIGMAREALLLEPAEGWHAHFELDPGESEGIEARLRALPAVEEDEYYAPSTRYDVVSIVFEALREGLRSRGLADVRFTPEDYGR
jgi:hypothetical protein